MARFYADIKGNRGEATRMGTAGSGITGHIRGWGIGCKVDINADGDDDICYIWLTSGSNGRYGNLLLGTFRPEDIANPAPPQDDVNEELVAACKALLEWGERCGLRAYPVIHDMARDILAKVDSSAE